jgi:hypothetical protein
MGLNPEQAKILHIFSNLIQSTWDRNNRTSSYGILSFQKKLVVERAAEGERGIVEVHRGGGAEAEVSEDEQKEMEEDGRSSGSGHGGGRERRHWLRTSGAQRECCFPAHEAIRSWDWNGREELAMTRRS